MTAFSGAPNTWGLLLQTIDVRPSQLTCITTSAQKIIAACEDVVNIYNAVTGVLQQVIHAPETVTKIQDSPDGSTLFFVHTFSVTMWDMQTGGLIHTFTTQSKINDVAVSTTHIACGSSNGTVTFWDIYTEEEGGNFGNSQPIVSICWSSPQELAVATQSNLYIHNITIGETIGSFYITGQVWGMVYLEDRDEFMVGTSRPGSGAGQEAFFIRCKQPQLDPQALEQEYRMKSIKLRQSSVHSGQLSSPRLMGEEILCMTTPGGVQSFDTRSGNWTNNPPLLDTAISVTMSLNRNLVVQTQDSIQIFSVDALKSNEARNVIYPSHIYPLGEKHIVCLLQPDGHITLLELESLQELHPDDHTLLLVDKLVSAHVSFGRGLVAELGASVIMGAWQSGTSPPHWAEATKKEAPLCGWSPKCTRVVTIHSSPQPELCVKDVKDGIILANLPLKDADFGTGEVYDLTFDSETRFSLKIDGPGWHFQIPHQITASPSGRYSHTITRGEPVTLSEPRPMPPYTLDTNCEWVIDAKCRKVCWISPGNIRRGHGGHFWAGLSLVMVGDDGVVRKLTFKEPDC